jgi:hypothetical protein
MTTDNVNEKFTIKPCESNLVLLRPGSVNRANPRGVLKDDYGSTYMDLSGSFQKVRTYRLTIAVPDRELH